MCNKYDVKLSIAEMMDVLRGAYPDYNFETDEYFDENYTDELMYPGGRVPAIFPTKNANTFRFVTTTWGFPTPVKQGGRDIIIPVNNKRDDRLDGYYAKALESRRCILPMTSIIEWPKDESGNKYEINIPYRITAEGEPSGLFFSAGLFDFDKKNREFFSTMITTSPNHRFALYHNRMPAILKLDNSIDYLIKDHGTARGMIGPGRNNDSIEWKGEMLIGIMGKTERAKLKKKSLYFRQEAV